MSYKEFDIMLSYIEDLEEAYFLDQTIRTDSDFGSYHYSHKGERIFITSDNFDGTCVLISKKAKNIFLDLLEKNWSEKVWV